MNANIGQLLNRRFECPGCHASGDWSASARAMIREASTIQGFGCRRCREEIVVKTTRTAACATRGEQLAREEYRVLCELQAVFPQDDEFGTLLPLGYLELEGYGAMITRKFDGVDLVRHAFRLSGSRKRGLFRPAGLLLRRLHDSCPKGYRPQTLRVEDKVAYLARTYGARLRSDRATCNICDQLVEEATRISAVQLRATWSHGDFKPENVLCDGHKYMILDTQLGACGVFVYDLASFLNHLLLASPGFMRSGIGDYQQVEEEFLKGYGVLNGQELNALRWAQLYFMLCYWGRYRQRGPLSGIYANWRIRPIVKKLAAQL